MQYLYNQFLIFVYQTVRTIVLEPQKNAFNQDVIRADATRIIYLFHAAQDATELAYFISENRLRHWHSAAGGAVSDVTHVAPLSLSHHVGYVLPLARKRDFELPFSFHFPVLSLSLPLPTPLPVPLSLRSSPACRRRLSRTFSRRASIYFVSQSCAAMKERTLRRRRDQWTCPWSAPTPPSALVLADEVYIIYAL